MILTLEVTGPQAQEMGAGARKAFKAIGGTIGRLPDNDWVFPDPYVSGRHALIRYVNGRFFVEDTSTNGVFINSPDNRLTRGQAQQLRDGDLLYIDAYQINVSIDNDAAERRNDPFAGLKSGAPKASAAASLAPAPMPAVAEDKTESLALPRADDSTIAQQLAVDRRDEEEETDEDEDEVEDDDAGTEWFGIADMAASKKPAPSPARIRPEVVKSTVAVPPPRPPVRRPPPVAKVVPSGPALRPASDPNPRSGSELTEAASDAQLKALLAAAGIEGLDPSSEAARTLGEILRVAVGGVMDALRSRERMKDDLRMRGTTFKATDNNPLKFSANVDDAFHNLLVKRNPAYLPPRDAFEDAFRDVREHQAAFLSAMRLAFESMLSQFDPQRMQEEFDRQMKGAILGVPAKLRYWDLYRDKYGELAEDAEAGFRALFGDAFARAYEEHLERLRNASRPAGQ